MVCLNSQYSVFHCLKAFVEECVWMKLSIIRPNGLRHFISADTKPEHMRSKISMISISDGKEMDDVQKSFLKLAELCMPNPLRFKVRRSMPYFLFLHSILFIMVQIRCLIKDESRPFHGKKSSTSLNRQHTVKDAQVTK